MTTATLDADPAGGPDTQVIKLFRVVKKSAVKFSSLGPHVVDAGIRNELFKSLGQVVPFGSCLFDWKIEHHTVDELDESGRRWDTAKEGDVVVQGYIRYQLPAGEDQGFTGGE